MCVWSRFSGELFVSLWTVACQAPLSLRFSRQEYESGLPLPSPGDLPDPGIEPAFPAAPALQANSLLMSHWGSLICIYLGYQVQIILISKYEPPLLSMATAMTLGHVIPQVLSRPTYSLLTLLLQKSILQRVTRVMLWKCKEDHIKNFLIKYKFLTILHKCLYHLSLVWLSTLLPCMSLNSICSRHMTFFL